MPACDWLKLSVAFSVFEIALCFFSIQSVFKHTHAPVFVNSQFFLSGQKIPVLSWLPSSFSSSHPPLLFSHVCPLSKTSHWTLLHKMKRLFSRSSHTLVCVLSLFFRLSFSVSLSFCLSLFLSLSLSLCLSFGLSLFRSLSCVVLITAFGPDAFWSINCCVCSRFICIIRPKSPCCCRHGNKDERWHTSCPRATFPVTVSPLPNLCVISIRAGWEGSRRGGYPVSIELYWLYFTWSWDIWMSLHPLLLGDRIILGPGRSVCDIQTAEAVCFDHVWAAIRSSTAVLMQRFGFAHVPSTSLHTHSLSLPAG